MSILKELSDVLKEVFWIKTSRKSKLSKRPKVVKKKTTKKISKPAKSVRFKKTPVTKALKEEKIVKPIKAAKLPKVVKAKKSLIDPKLVQTGEITHYFDRINVCVVKITQGTILIGDKLTFLGPKTKFVQKVWSMQIESEDVKVAKKGQLIGLKVDKPVTVGDIVYK